MEKTAGLVIPLRRRSAGSAPRSVVAQPGGEEPPKAEVTTTPATPATPNRRWDDGAGAGADAHAAPRVGSRLDRHHWKAMVGGLSQQAVETARVVRHALDFFGAPRPLRKVLEEAVGSLLEMSLRAQQISRLASGRVKPQRERVSLDALVRGVLDQRQDLSDQPAVQASIETVPVDVLTDASATTTMLEALLDWTALRGRPLSVAVEAPRWPAPASIRLRIGPAAGDGQPAGGRRRRMDDGLHRLLALQVAVWLELDVLWREDGAETEVHIGFPQTYRDHEGLSTLEVLNDHGATAAGRVLVVAADEELLGCALDVLAAAGLAVRGASDCAAAGQLLLAEPPSVLVLAYDVARHDFARLWEQARATSARCSLVEITREEPSFAGSGFARCEIPRVGRPSLGKDLPVTVLFELAKQACP